MYLGSIPFKLLFWNSNNFQRNSAIHRGCINFGSCTFANDFIFILGKAQSNYYHFYFDHHFITGHEKNIHDTMMERTCNCGLWTKHAFTEKETAWLICVCWSKSSAFFFFSHCFLLIYKIQKSRHKATLVLNQQGFTKSLTIVLNSSLVHIFGIGVVLSICAFKPHFGQT